MRAFKSFVAAQGLMAAAVLTGCMAEEGTWDDQDVGEYSSELTQEGTQGPHCVVESVAQRQGEAPPTELDMAPARCFETFSDAIFAATDGRVRLAPSVTAQTVDEQTLRGGDMNAPLATFVIAIEYQHINFGGATMTITSSVTCDGYNHSFPFSSFPAGWNDIISSARAFSNCNNSYHYEHAGFGGAVVNCGSACSYVGNAMNDRTSSIFWTR